jgi:hypothetical protein
VRSNAVAIRRRPKGELAKAGKLLKEALAILQ